jgi:hypothetical protein
LSCRAATVYKVFNEFVAPDAQNWIPSFLSHAPLDSGKATMARIPRKPGYPRENLSSDLLALYDRLAEFSDHCAFLCDAFAAIPACEETIDPATTRGIGLNAQWMKRRIQELTLELKRIREQNRFTARK